ncbi:complement factor H isoform X2 [Myiozetetes cayanensis]|uniref:complement factor H isoform X2 n=1 Tax=Myiozetetes cayanensis TaxID=478635 RepID=UPI00215E2CB9|nr:complement factor H isoform X2 [Myiozetetes cayanensis]
MLLLGYAALLLCWMYCSAQRACEQPPPRRVKEVPTKVWDKPPYPHGTPATYSCRPGYIKHGRIMFQCNDGVWQQQPPLIECINKPCGHPGDAQFGSFELTMGHDFVFGARVEYRCNDGYQMLSQRNYRECQADGWSNDIPHCEVVKCLPVEAPKNGKIIMAGAFELDQEYSFGQVVNFECNAKYKLVGAKEIICSSDGRWSDDVPQCQDITCDVPEILNGFVHSPKKSYKELEILQFSCDKGYRYGERGDALCTETGWNPPPYCIKVVCSPPVVRHGSFGPEKPSYEEGDTINVQCDDGYHFIVLTDRSTAECTKNGWVPIPSCVFQMKPCDYPNIENGRLERLSYYRFPLTIGQTVYYTCSNGYLTHSGDTWQQISCSARGLQPEPKCLKICNAKQIQNGYVPKFQTGISYKEGDRAAYACHSGYQTEHEEVTCTRNGWSPHPRCVREKKCERRAFENGYFTLSRTTFRFKEVTSYRCQDGFVTAEGEDEGETQCRENGWTPPPKCIRSCKAPKDILIHHTNKTVFIPGDRIEYSCLEGYKIANHKPTDTTECGINGEWSPAPWKDKYLNGDVVTFSCAKNFVRVGFASVQCYSSGWFPSLPECKDPSPQCELPVDVDLVSPDQHPMSESRTGFHEVIHYRCAPGDENTKQATCVSGKWTPEIKCPVEEGMCPPPPPVSGVQQTTAGRYYRNGSKKVYSCPSGFQLIGANEITCTDGKWQAPPHCVEKPCLPPQTVECADPPRLENPNLKTEKEEKSIYLAGAKFKYVARSGYTLNGSTEINCTMGEWTAAPTCLEMSCGSIPKVAHAQFEGRNKKTYEPGETILYRCDAGFQTVGSPEIICREGNWTAPPSCEVIHCGPAPEIQDGNIASTPQERYLPDATVNYQCESNFQMIGDSSITCINGEWSRAPECRDTKCRPPPEIAGGRINMKKSKYLPGETATYECWQGFKMTGTSTVVCQNGIWTELPKCKGRGRKCGKPSGIESGEILSTLMSEYEQDTTLEYKCPDFYVLEGSQYITCTDGKWSNPPVCLVACTASKEDMDRNNIELRWSHRTKLYSISGDTIEFQCKPGYFEEQGISYRVKCVEGVIDYPRCTSIRNCIVNRNHMESNNIQLRSGQSITSTYRSGTEIFFECKRGYQRVSNPGKFRVQCRDGEITYPTCRPSSP